MPFIGNKPSAVPLTSADITDGIIVNADINTSAAITTEKLSLISTASVASVTAKGTPSVSDGYIQLNCEQNSHGIKIKSPPHSAGANYTLVMPSATGTSLQSLRMNSGATALEFATPSGGTNTPNFFINDTSGQSLPDNTETKLNYATEIYDTANAFASSRFTVPSGQAGKYHFTATVGIQQASTVTELTIYIKKNGVTQLAGDGQNSNYPYALASGTLDLIVGDYVEVFCYHAFGSAQTRQTSTEANYFQAFKLIE